MKRIILDNWFTGLWMAILAFVVFAALACFTLFHPKLGLGLWFTLIVFFCGRDRYLKSKLT